MIQTCPSAEIENGCHQLACARDAADYEHEKTFDIHAVGIQVRIIRWAHGNISSAARDERQEWGGRIELRILHAAFRLAVRLLQGSASETLRQD